MILLLGEDNDSILYFSSRLDSPRRLSLPYGIEATLGRLGSEEAIVASIGNSMLFTGIRTSLLLERYKPYLVISLGAAVSLKKDFHQGDVLIADRYYCNGVDFTVEGKTKYGQFPGLPEFLTADASLNNQAEAAAYSVGGVYIERGFLLSGDAMYQNASDYESMLSSHFAGQDRMIAYDTTSAGIAYACHLHSVALLTFKTISYEPTHPEQWLTRKRRALEASPRLGEIIIAMLVRNRETI
ncbi:MAG: hypothetical protein SPG64_01365 [Candidatus Enteromonas sp.]|nr:hypothetical protein [Candidatus Enteromonas sp.]